MSVFDSFFKLTFKINLVTLSFAHVCWEDFYKDKQ